MKCNATRDEYRCSQPYGHIGAHVQLFPGRKVHWVDDKTIPVYITLIEKSPPETTADLFRREFPFDLRDHLTTPYCDEATERAGEFLDLKGLAGVPMPAPTMADLDVLESLEKHGHDPVEYFQGNAHYQGEDEEEP